MMARTPHSPMIGRVNLLMRALVVVPMQSFS